MEKRFQVFVSSTYLDLQRERWEVMQALLELDCIPSGMELFPAADDDQWSYIQRVIDDCDYYVLLLGGRYGSVSSKTGKSYTHMEYDYAIEQGKPVIAFIHENPGSLPTNNSEGTDEGRRQLQEFRTQVQQRLCKKWANLDQLGAVVSRSITQLIKQKPAVGWVRADRVPDESAAQEIVRLRRQIEELEEQLKGRKPFELGLSVEDLAQGRDYFSMRFQYLQEEDDEQFGVYEKSRSIGISTYWDKIFTTLAPSLVDGASESQVRNLLNEVLYLQKPSWRERGDISQLYVIERDFQSIKAQMRVLGLIEVSEPEGALHMRHWRLTQQGDLYVLRVKAVTRKMSTS